MLLPPNIKVVPIFGNKTIFFEVWKNKNFIYAIEHGVNKEGVERWSMTDETFDSTVDNNQIRNIGAAIESMDL